ncbi:MAG: hypothetical protein EU541_00160 [Promethearchaeota archaeon]|nr:MAG: hypothetical protein EU541_00160 [Candidatus Lokiarchaeota archaeon]
MNKLRTGKSQSILGFCILKLGNNQSLNDYELVFKKGLRDPLIQNVIESNKQEIMQKEKGNSIIPLDEVMIIIHFFEDSYQNKIILIFMDDKERDINFTQLYLISKEIFKKFSSQINHTEIKTFCNEIIKIPQSEDLIGIFILNPSGSPYFTKINKERAGLANKDVQISGFISAILTFSKEVISQDSGGNLKEINFGNQRFFTIIRNNVIFAYLVENANKLFKRYMQIVVDEFFSSYKKELEQYNGDISPFKGFENTLNKYFKI